MKMGSSSDEFLGIRIATLSPMADGFITKQTHRHAHREDAGKEASMDTREERGNWRGAQPDCLSEPPDWDTLLVVMCSSSPWKQIHMLSIFPGDSPQLQGVDLMVVQK